MQEKVPNSMQGLHLHCCHRDCHRKALAQLVPWNIPRVHDDGEGVRGEAEAGVEIRTRQ